MVGGGREVVGGWLEVVVVGNWLAVVVWRLQPGSKGVVLLELHVFPWVTEWKSSRDLFFSTVYILSDQQAARISHLEIQHGGQCQNLDMPSGSCACIAQTRAFCPLVWPGG